jgi:S1-C subfamily serine protease
VGVLVGLGIGHGVWTTTHAASATTPSPPNGFQAPGGNSAGSSGTGPASGSGGGSTHDLTGPAARVAGALVDVNVVLSYEDMEAEGTGIVLTPDGLVLTNNHVIAGATSITVHDIGNNRQYPAEVVGYDRARDVALIQMKGASGLQTASIGSSANLSVGQAVVGIGNAGGVGALSSAPGEITGLGKTIQAQDESTGTTETLTDLIQTNCDIQPGDSGGPLINSSGQVVGMDTAASVGYFIQVPGNQGFSIPIDAAMGIATDIRDNQATSGVHIGPTAFLGVQVETPASGSGALVHSVISGGAAAAAGIQADDVITALGGDPVNSPDNLTQLLIRYHPGDSVQVTWQDPNGGTHSAQVKLGSGPAQ